MKIWPEIRAASAVLLGALIATRPAHALVSLNEGRDRLFVNASTTITADSNVFANSDGTSDFVYSTSMSADYTRRAGWIGVNANVGVTSSRFASLDEQNFTNPTFGLEFTKQTGRTTGSLTLSASRESRADAAINTRSTYWNIPVGLNFKYPIVGTYTLAGSLGYSSRRYLDETVYSSLATYSAALDLFHVLTTERDVVVGYRYRHSQTSRETSSTDHGVSAGVSGKIVRGITGSVRAGYQTRIPSRATATGETKFDSWTASGVTTYAINKKLNINGTVSKDFSTTATDASVDTTAASIEAQYAYSSHWTGFVSTGYGNSQFLGEAGRVVLDPGPPPLLGQQREDSYWTISASVNYSLNEHFKASLTYTWFKNWSTISFADFERDSWALNLSTRW